MIVHCNNNLNEQYGNVAKYSFVPTKRLDQMTLRKQGMFSTELWPRICGDLILVLLFLSCSCRVSLQKHGGSENWGNNLVDE